MASCSVTFEFCELLTANQYCHTIWSSHTCSSVPKLPEIERNDRKVFGEKRTTPHLEKVHDLASRILSFHFDKLIR